MVRLIALKPHSPDGSRRFQIGDVYEISEKSSGILIKTGLAKLEGKTEARTYKRRDMKAEG